MGAIDSVVDFLEGGEAGCLYDILCSVSCGDCNPPEDCDGCDWADLIGEVEEQIAQSGLDHMKLRAQEWVKYSMEALNDTGANIEVVV